MDLDMDPDDIFRDDEDDFDNDLYKQREATKEFVVYLVDASPKMFNTTSPDVDNTDENHFHIAHSCISQSLKTQIINSSYDEVAICFFNTREKKNLQDLNGVFVFNVADRDYLDRPTARLIKEFDLIEESFMKDIGSRYGIVSGSRDNSLYNAIWVAQALLRKGSAKTADKRILLFTNEDDPFGGLKGAVKIDMVNTTLQRAKDAQDLGISIEVLPLGRPEEEFNISLFYADLIGLEGDELAQFMPSAGERLEDMKDQLRKRLFKKRIVRKINFAIANGLSIELNTYALIRPTTPGAITWLDSVTNHPLKTERSFICADTGALLQNSTKLFYPYKNESIKLSVEELSEIKRTSIRNLRLLGFKSLSCLKDYHNLRPSTFLFPSEEEEITKAGGQVEPPGMHMIYLPYSDDIRDNEELHSTSGVAAPCATDEQVRKAASLMKRIDLKDFSVCQFANPALQRHYAVLQTLALDEDEMPDIKDETVPDEEGMSRPGVVNALEEFKLSIYGDTYDEETENAGDKKESEASKKRKATSEIAVQEYAKYDWGDLADNGKLKDLTAAELKYYLTANNIPVAGKKEALISRILTHMGK
ncbi:ATP-dependent DNA helicase 2 subunit KU70 isoform X4 [Humulus lupulus]|uniref:ATP-dependent DNA helicase 2 subunit KU70 isoform X4 n=1 Tax=Humulus lupulus TaxID=3486 RepID=UPI002B40A695|nr:ATP-dependent DNA helicase 2 subunit KU70 isoform X4 [Humulus lupulus]